MLRRAAIPLFALILLAAAWQPAHAQHQRQEELPEDEALDLLLLGPLDIPDDLPDPQRWRFTSNRRLPEGHFFERLFLTSFILPIASFEPALGVGGGLGFVDLDFRHQGRIEQLGLITEYTSEGQQSYVLRWQRLLYHRRHGGGVFREERNRVYATAGYVRPLTLRYFGRGDETLESDESSYRDEQIRVEGGAVFSIPAPTGDLLLDVAGIFETHSIGPGFAEDVPPTTRAFPQEVAASPDSSAFRVLLGATVDTRDSFSNPYRGLLCSARAELQPFKSDGVRTDRFILNASAATPVWPLFHDGGNPVDWNPPTDVLAFGARMEWIEGDEPIYLQPALGGPDTLRGYIRGRWHGRVAASASLEYRPVVLAEGFPLPWLRGLRVEHLGLVLFADVGTVADDFDHLDEADWKLTPGVGLRVMLERDAPLRLDIGFSDEGTEVALQFGQAF